MLHSYRRPAFRLLEAGRFVFPRSRGAYRISMATHYYTASSLDGFIATPEHSLDWLFKQDFDPEGPMAYPKFMESVGALVMGSSTYEWLRRAEEQWPYELPAWVLSSRDLATPDTPPGAEVRIVRGDVADLHPDMVASAGGKDVWVMGGGDLVGQFAAAGLLDEVWVQFAPVTLGQGQPLLPGGIDLELIDVQRNRAFVCTRYKVVAHAS